MRIVRHAGFALAASFCAAVVAAAACGSDQLTHPNFGSPPDAAPYDAGLGAGGGGYGYGYGGGSTTDAAVHPPIDASTGRRARSASSSAPRSSPIHSTARRA